mmetsp:Transcript_25758/g.38976  ORF Transcript_25758/g.38976 Transcript_25758/m.38976 type:complete len:135 (+) Transcript_25758:105-509(+)|eukprot:CAMPEP_0178917236 /NCGR_PEP_ID=MMETSP0786-20121207/13131_1 /TAXON_ID=186022 /ORGANISM="Thalassionema frauenfeldii, Strain CCMP 1798" /LENGTH=134 /DNA_ID=CAMNT_0020590757 /DNA_START=60 /DNA_END=464 /DNA_ORIENTATION=+
MTTEGGNWKDLVRAAKENEHEIVAYHLQRGVDPNFQHPEYMTSPLIEAIRHGNLEIVRILLQEGKASPVLPEDISGSTPLEVASEGNEGSEDMVQLLLQFMSEADKQQQLAILHDAQTTSITGMDSEIFSCSIL